MIVGREREQGVLRDHLAAALDGRGSLVLIGGEAGIGKTTLADGLCHEAAEQGAYLLVGRCYDLTETPPYGPWVELFGRYQQREDMPPLPTAFAHRGIVGAVTSAAALFQQVEHFCVTLTSRMPLVLLLDDLHWADPASLDLLRFLARSLATLPLLLIVTYRADELTRRHPLYQLLPLLVRESGAARLDLGRLSDAAIRALVESCYRLVPSEEARLVAYLRERAEGNALFVTEVLRTLEETTVLHEADGRWDFGEAAQVAVPSLLTQVIEGRVERLGEEVHRLLAVAAVIGQETPLAIWSAVTEVDEEILSAVVEQGAAAHLIDETPDGSSARFVHALISETLYEGIPPSRRRRLHRQIGEALIVRENADPDAVAYHFQRAGDARATEWLIKAGERAQRAYAWLTAAERFETALALMEGRVDAGARGWLLFRLALLRRYERPEQEIAHFDEAARLAAEAGDAVLAARVRLYQGLTRCYLGEMQGGLADLRAGVESLDALAAAGERYTPLDAIDATNGRGTLVLWLATAGYLDEALSVGAAHLATAPPTLGDAEAASYADSHGGSGLAYAFKGRPREAREHTARSIAINRAIGHRHVAVGIMQHALHYIRLPYEGDYVAERRRDADELDAAAAAAWTGTMRAVAPQGVTRADVLLLEGRWEAIRNMTFSLVAESSLGIFIVETVAHLAVAEGNAEKAWAYVRAWLPEAHEMVPGSRRFPSAIALQRVAATCAIATRDLATAKAWLEAHDRWLGWSGAVLGQSEGQALWGAYHRAAGDADLAYRHATQALNHATAPRQPLALLAAHRFLGELATDAGRFDDAEKHLDASLALADACAAPYERALTLLAFAEWRAAIGHRAEAMTLLDEVRALCTPLGAKPALARADALAARLATTKPAPPAPPAGLSAREIEVLRLVVAGQTNRDIADALFLSEHTVRVHVRNILTKTESDNRAAATAFALRHGLA